MRTPIRMAMAMVLAVVTLACSGVSTPAPSPEPPSVVVREVDQAAVKAFLDGWEADWEGRVATFDGYAARYAPTFHAAYKDQDRDAWLEGKRRRAELAQCIDVTVIAPRATALDHERIEVRFRQRFVSDAFCDEGAKTLVLEPAPGGFRVVAEEQPEAVPCDERCPVAGDIDDVQGSYERSCNAAFELHGDLGSADECVFVEADFEQNCAEDRFGCRNVGSTCEMNCDQPCLDCQAACRSTCEDCRRRCASDAENPDCIPSCAQRRADCRERCMDARSRCSSACGEQELLCDREGEEQVAATCPRCAEMSGCWNDECRATFADEPQECWAWCSAGQ